MPSKKIFLFIFWLALACGFNGYAQFYPVQASTQLLPPYSVYLSDYATAGSDKLRVILVQGDFTQPEYQLRLVMSVELDGRIIMRTSRFFNPPPISISPGLPVAISGAELAPYLDSRNIDFVGYSREQYERTRALPEGGYRIIFTAYDFRRQDVQVSNQASSFYYLAKNEPPLINFPACGTRIGITTPQQIIFSWLPRNTASPMSAAETQYEFSLYEVRPINRNPNDVVLTTPPVYQFTTDLTQLVYGPGEPMLIENLQYVWRVRATDRNGKDAFRNNGYSEVCTFTYGGVDASSLASVQGVQAIGETERRGKVWWTAEGYDGYRVFYKKRGAGFEWFKQDTNEGELKLLNLEPSLEYETRVQGKKAGAFGPYSSIVTFVTKPKVEKDCGYPSGVPQDKGKPYEGAVYGGLVVNARGLDMEMKEVTKLDEPGWYKGVGVCRVPYLGGSGYHAKFDRIYINDNLEVILGRIDFVSKGVAAMTVDQLTNETRVNRERIRQANRDTWRGTDFYEGVVFFGTVDIKTIEAGESYTSPLEIVDEQGNHMGDARSIAILIEYPTKAIIIQDQGGDQWVVQREGDKVTVTKVAGGGLLDTPTGGPRTNCPPNVNCDIPILSREGEEIVKMMTDAKDVSNPLKYPGIKIFHTSKIGAAVTLPGIGIFINSDVFGGGNGLDKVTQHEYGHFLDYKNSGSIDLMPSGVRLFGYYTLIGLPSIFSASILNSAGGNHSNYWTEVRANKLAKSWFKDNYIADEVNYPTEEANSTKDRSIEAAYGVSVYSTDNEDLYEYPEIIIQEITIEYDADSEPSLFFKTKNGTKFLNAELLRVLWQYPSKEIIIQDKDKGRWRLGRDAGTAEPVVKRIEGAYTSSVDLVKSALLALGDQYKDIKKLEDERIAKKKAADDYVDQLMSKYSSTVPIDVPNESESVSNDAIGGEEEILVLPADEITQTVEPPFQELKEAEHQLTVAQVVKIFVQDANTPEQYQVILRDLSIEGKKAEKAILDLKTSGIKDEDIVKKIKEALVKLISDIIEQGY
jgi:TANFOR domain-containing protein